MAKNKLDKLIVHARKYLKKASTKAIYTVFLMYYAYRNKETPAWAKRIILGSFAYFLSPIDSIPDFTPIIGMTDDLGVLSFGLATIACYINEEVKLKARAKLDKVFPEKVDESELQEINEYL